MEKLKERAEQNPESPRHLRADPTHFTPSKASVPFICYRYLRVLIFVLNYFTPLCILTQSLPCLIIRRQIE